MTVQTAAPAATCPRCQRGKETFLYLSNQYQFDVDRARQLVADGREPMEIEDDSVRASVEESVIDDGHVFHVDPTIPGIIAHLFHTDADGQVVQAHLLIDGHHRAARCLQEGLPFAAFLLSEQESKDILLRTPDHPEFREAVSFSEADFLAGETIVGDITRAYADKFAASRRLSDRGGTVIAGATTHDRRNFGPFRVYVDRCDGAYKWDVAGNRLIDFWMGHGTLLMGHGYAPVVEAIRRQVERGTHYGACHELEVRWAELICRLVPSAQQVRFTSSGTEANLLAGRVARAFTGRKRIVKFDGHFHGWHDEGMAYFFDHDASGFHPDADKHLGLAHQLQPDEVLGMLSQGDVAAVLLEPGGGSAGGLPFSPQFLQTLREATAAHGTLLIFDEVVSGFRHAPGGVQQATGVIPDLTTLAKILCGGLPGGTVVGRADIMAVFGSGTQVNGRKAQVPHTGTFNANPMSAAAGIAMLENIGDGAAQEQAAEQTERLVRGVNRAARRYGLDVTLYKNETSIYHILIGAHRLAAPLAPSPAVTQLYRSGTHLYALLRRTLLLEGLDTHPVHGWVSAVHTDEVIDESIEAFDRAFARLRTMRALQR